MAKQLSTDDDMLFENPDQTKHMVPRADERHHPMEGRVNAVFKIMTEFTSFGVNVFFLNIRVDSYMISCTVCRVDIFMWSRLGVDFCTDNTGIVFRTLDGRDINYKPPIPLLCLY